MGRFTKSDAIGTVVLVAIFILLMLTVPPTENPLKIQEELPVEATRQTVPTEHPATTEARFELTDEETQSRLDRREERLEASEALPEPAPGEESLECDTTTTERVEESSEPVSVPVKIEAELGAIAPETTTTESLTIRPRAELYDPGKESLEESGATLTSLGVYRIVGYDPWCSHCVGKTVPNGITASGELVTIGKTIAMHNSIPFGTEIYVEGLGVFAVEDRGVGRGVIDIALGSHAECYAITSRREAYIVERMSEDY